VADLPDAVVLDRPAAGPARVRFGERPAPLSLDTYQRRSA
jgi:hypothetical protein